MDKVADILPKDGNLNRCLTCGAGASGCPATGLEGMDTRTFLGMAALGMDELFVSALPQEESDDPFALVDDGDLRRISCGLTGDSA